MDVDSEDGIWVELTEGYTYARCGGCTSAAGSSKSTTAVVVKYSQLVVAYIKWCTRSYFWRLVLFNTDVT